VRDLLVGRELKVRMPAAEAAAGDELLGNQIVGV
jgi:hypothetical protein